MPQSAAPSSAKAPMDAYTNSTSDGDTTRSVHPSEKIANLTVFQAISTPKCRPHPDARKKRTLSTSMMTDKESDDASSSDSGNAKEPRTRTSTPTTRPKKQRKRSHELTREAKERLLDELRYLEARAALLRHEHGLADPQVLTEKLALNADLRDAVLQQDLVVANSQSLLSGLTNSRVTSPLESYIHLTKDWNQRRAVLLAMKDKKVDVAHRFLLERTRYMEPLQECCEESQFKSEDGDWYTIKMDVTPFEGVASVRQVFDAMQFYFANMEISLTEMSGDVTIREDEDNTEKTVLHHRLVTSEQAGVLVEKNAVLFFDQSGLDSENVDDQSAIVAIDFVDRDDLYPYCPSQRLRKDATGVMKLSAHRRKRPQSSATAALPSAASESEADELVVVLTRWVLIRLRDPEIEIPSSVLHAISKNLSSVIDTMFKSMKEGVYPTTGQKDDRSEQSSRFGAEEMGVAN